MRLVPGSLPAFAMLALLVVGLAGMAVADSVSLDAMLTKLAPPPSGEALSQIPDPGRKLLGLRSYVGYGAKIADRWSWTKVRLGPPPHNLSCGTSAHQVRCGFLARARFSQPECRW